MKYFLNNPHGISENELKDWFKLGCDLEGLGFCLFCQYDFTLKSLFLWEINYMINLSLNLG